MTTPQLELRAHTPQAFVCMGIRLRPLTLGHLSAMRLMDVDPPRNPGDLGTAVIICATRQDRVMRTLGAWWMRLFLAVWRRLLGEWDFQRESQRFADYVTFNTELPMLSRTRETAASPPSAIPFDRMLRTILTSRLGYRPEAVNSVPYLEALWGFVSWAEMEDRIRVMDRSEADVDAAMAALDWEEIRKRGAAMFASPTNENQ